MYYFEKYDALILFLSMAIFSIALFVLFRGKISSLIDPLIIHLLWCASCVSLLLGYFYSKGIDLDGGTFVLVYVFYLIGLYFFLDTSAHKKDYLAISLYDDRNVRLFYISFILNIVSRYQFINYAISNPSIIEWFLYKFKQIESLSFIQYVLQIGARPFFTYYTFVLIHTKKSWRLPLVVLLLLNVLLDIFAGGRAAVVGLIVAFGFYVYVFKPFFSRKRISQINKFSILLITFAILIGAVITSFYKKEGTVEDGVLSMVNRLLAAGDGLEMYLNNHGSVYVRSGPSEYIKSVFGIFLKRILPIQSQSVGWQLYEIEHGIISSTPVGPNYILPLQVFVLGKVFLPFYCIFISYIVAFLRGNKLSRSIITSPELSFVLGLLSFEPVLDIELFVLVICSCLSVYALFIYPVKKIKFIFDWRTIIWLNVKKQEG